MQADDQVTTYASQLCCVILRPFQGRCDLLSLSDFSHDLVQQAEACLKFLSKDILPVVFQPYLGLLRESLPGFKKSRAIHVLRYRLIECWLVQLELFE
jgi:hypothetical protein